MELMGFFSPEPAPVMMAPLPRRVVTSIFKISGWCGAHSDNRLVEKNSRFMSCAAFHSPRISLSTELSVLTKCCACLTRDAPVKEPNKGLPKTGDEEAEKREEPSQHVRDLAQFITGPSEPWV